MSGQQSQQSGQIPAIQQDQPAAAKPKPQPQAKPQIRDWASI